MQLCERIKYIRETLEMSRASFGQTLGVSGDVVNNWERGRVDIKDYVLKLICQTYHVSYAWLSEEKGDPFVSPPEILIDEVIEKYKLDSFDRSLIEEYVKLSPETRNNIKEMLRNVFGNENSPG
mgnify:CR=1 FL=1